MQQCIKILLFLILNEVHNVQLLDVVNDNVQQLQSDNLPRYYAKPEAACAVLGSWWWAVCRPKYVELYLK
jgi:hypothetical protein